MKLVNSIYKNCNKNNRDNCIVEKILLNDNNNNKDENIILVYNLRANINNNKILILTDKIKNVNHSNFDITYFNNNNIDYDYIINTNEYNYIFSENIIDNDDYILLTHFYLNLNKNNTDIISLNSYKYSTPKYINDYNLQTYINTDISYIITIPNNIYEYRPNYGSSKIIWAPSWSNINNDHFLIRKINEFGFTYYNRKSNLIDVVVTNNQENINKYSNDIKNPLNICIYQENYGNVLNMVKKVYMVWFFDSFRNKTEYDDDDLYLYQFPFYYMKENILKQRYNLPIDINRYNYYPNCLPIVFNIDMLLGLYEQNKSNNNDRSLTCYVLRKTHDTHPLKFIDSIHDYFIHPEDSINIDKNNMSENIEIFQKCKKFYCYDNVSFLAPMAVMCGCETILIQNYPGLKDIREIYKTYSPWMYYGIAYGDNEESLEFARNTKHILIDILKKIKEENYFNFTSDNNCDNAILSLLKYLECYFQVSFNN
jgi:hypothetical protein